MPEVSASEQAELAEIALSELTPLEEVTDETYELAVWETAYVNSLPDSCFAYIESGGQKDSEGKTVPRSLRHFPYKDASGKVDPAHVRNALARIPQSNLPQAAKDAALAKIRSAARGVGVEVNMSEESPVEVTEVPPQEPEAYEPPDEPVEETVDAIVDQIMSSVSKLDAKIRYKRGAPALRGQFKDAISAYVTRIAASEGEAEASPSEDAGKEMNSMQKLVEYFKLSEDADEDAVMAAVEAQVTELTEARDTAVAEKEAMAVSLAETVEKLSEAEAKLDEQEKVAREAEMEHRFSEAIKDGIVLPADIGDEENPGWLRKLAETSEELFAQYLDSRKSPAVDLSEKGSGSNDEAAPEEKLRVDARLAKKAREMKEEHPELSLAECQNKVLADNPEMLTEYRELKQAQLTNIG